MSIFRPFTFMYMFFIPFYLSICNFYSVFMVIFGHFLNNFFATFSDYFFLHLFWDDDVSLLAANKWKA